MPMPSESNNQKLHHEMKHLTVNPDGGNNDPSEHADRDSSCCRSLGQPEPYLAGIMVEVEKLELIR